MIVQTACNYGLTVWNGKAQTFRQGLNGLHLTVNLRAEGTAQLAGTCLMLSSG